MQRAAQLVKEVTQTNNGIGSGVNSVIGSAASIANVGSSKNVSSFTPGNLSLPPSGKHKKAQAGSSSSRARNVSHITNKDSDKEFSQSKKTAKKEPLSNIVKKEKKPKQLFKTDASSSFVLPGTSSVATDNNRNGNPTR